MGLKEIRQAGLRALEKAAAGRGKLRVPPSFSAALAGALVFGILAQGMGLFNKFSWHDDIFSLFMTGTAVQLGRWMLHVLGELEKWFYGNGYFSLPLVNGMLSLLCVGLSAGLLAVHFRIRSRILSALTGGIMAVFPALTSLFGFMYTVHYYMFALLMMTGGAILICSEKPGWKIAAGILLCGCAVGVYQALLPFLLAMLLMDLVMTLTQREEKTGFYFRRILLLGVSAAAVMGVYFAGNALFLRFTNLRMDDYLGLNEMGGAPLAQYLAGAGRAYREFFFPSHFVLWDMYPQSVFNQYRLMLALDAALGAVWIVRSWKKGPVRALLLAAALALVPLACNFMFVLSGEVHSLMVYGQVMQMVLLACLAEWTEFPRAAFRRPAAAAAAAVLAVSGVMYVRYDNQCYMKTAFQQQEAISWNTTLVTRIESAPGFRDELPVAFVNRKNMQDRNLYNLEELDFLSLGTYDANIREYLNDWAWDSFLARWCGFEPKTVKPEKVEDWPEVREMPCYPDDGSIRVVRDVVVVKF